MDQMNVVERKCKAEENEKIWVPENCTKEEKKFKI